MRRSEKIDRSFEAGRRARASFGGLLAAVLVGGLLAAGWAVFVGAQPTQAFSTQDQVQQIQIRNSRLGCQPGGTCITVVPPLNLPGTGSVGASCLYYSHSGTVHGLPAFNCLFPGYAWAIWTGGVIPAGQCRDIWQNGYPTNRAICIYPSSYFATPPTCTIEATTYEVLNDETRIKITLANPNGADMNIDSANYTIERSGSPDNQLAVDALAVVGNPSVIAAGGEAVLYSMPQVINQNGNYDVGWEIAASIGTESWTTTAGDIQTATSDACQSSLRIAYRPFIKVFYGGLAAGGNFGTSNSSSAPCGDDFTAALGDRTATAFVAGHAEVTPAGDPRGSSAEYALQANNMIGEFYSASQRVADPQPLKGLTLGNNNNLHVYGGNFGRKACITNYWRLAERLELSTKPSPLTLDLKMELEANERRRYELLAGERLELSASAPLGGLKATLYIEGDVLISGNIIAGDDRWYDPSEIGYLSIIVKGNIDIAADVTEINALLVAYPQLDAADNVVDGRIRTCWHPSLTDPTSPPNIHFHTCDKQLVINGALIAEKVLFGRVHSSVKQETIEPPEGGLPPAYGNMTTILGGENWQSFCQLALSAYSGDTDITRLIWPIVKYNIGIYSGGLYSTTSYFADYDSSPYTCGHVGYLLEHNVLRGAENNCSLGRFCWGHQGPAANMYGGNSNSITASDYFHITGFTMPPHKNSPNITTTRGRFAIWLARALNGGQDPAAPPAGTPSPFTDVDETQDWWPHVYYLANHPNINLGHLSWPYEAEVTILLELLPFTNSQGTFTYSPSRFGHRGFASNPTRFFPDNNTTAGWAGIIAAKAFAIPAQPNLDPFNASLPYHPDISRIVNLNGRSTNITRYHNGSVHTYTNLMSWFPNRNDPIHYPYTPEVIEAFRQSARLYKRHATCNQGYQFCNFGINVTRKPTLARILASAMAYSGITTQAGLRPRTTLAGEVINLLPEYLIGTPELPLFGDQFYKTDSFSILPVNF